MYTKIWCKILSSSQYIVSGCSGVSGGSQLEGPIVLDTRDVIRPSNKSDALFSVTFLRNLHIEQSSGNVYPEYLSQSGCDVVYVVAMFLL